MRFQLVWRAAGRNEMNLIEIKTSVCGASDRQVAVMNWVERSAKQRDAARMMFCGGALRLRCGQYASQGSLRLFSHKFLKGTGDVWPARASAFSFEVAAKSSPDSGAIFGILSSASAMERTRSRTPSPAAAEMA